MNTHFLGGGGKIWKKIKKGEERLKKEKGFFLGGGGNFGKL